MDDRSDKVALVDLDGTIADYDGEMKKEQAALRSPSEPPSYDRYLDEKEPEYIERRRKLIQQRPGFWRNLPRHPLGFHIDEDLRKVGFILHVLTKGPANSSGAWGEKLEWCKEHLPDAAVTITQDKSLVYGRVLIDDYPPYFTGWLKNRPRGLVICVAHPWNERYDLNGSLWEHSSKASVIRYDGTNRQAYRERLQKAFDRQSREM